MIFKSTSSVFLSYHKKRGRNLFNSYKMSLYNEQLFVIVHTGYWSLVNIIPNDKGLCLGYEVFILHVFH